MRLNKDKIDLAMAQRKIAYSEIVKAVSVGSVNRARSGASVRPATAGRIADALGVPVEDLLEEANSK